MDVIGCNVESNYNHARMRAMRTGYMRALRTLYARVVLRSGREPPVSVKKCRVFGGSSGLRVFAFHKKGKTASGSSPGLRIHTLYD